ncbi:MAG: hypothetical protein IPM99_07245 [Rubrivivax sp.]|nr:hypothetical protein [Rubrivivax sp.]
MRRLHDDGWLLDIGAARAAGHRSRRWMRLRTTTCCSACATKASSWPWPVHRLDKAYRGLVLTRDAEAARALGNRPFEAGAPALPSRWCAARHRRLQSTTSAGARSPSVRRSGQETRARRTHWRRLSTFEWPFSVDGRHPTSRYALVGSLA